MSDNYLTLPRGAVCIEVYRSANERVFHSLSAFRNQRWSTIYIPDIKFGMLHNLCLVKYW